MAPIFPDTTVQDVIEGVSGVALSNFAFFRSVTEVVVTAASKEIYNINTEELRKLAEKYVPIEGLDMIQKGLSVMHYSPNSNSDIKDKQEQVRLLNTMEPPLTETPLYNGHLRTTDRYFCPNYSIMKKCHLHASRQLSSTDNNIGPIGVRHMIAPLYM